MKLTSKELKRRARAALAGKYMFAVSCIITANMFHFLMTFLLQNTGFFYSELPMNRAFFWIMAGIILLLSATLSAGINKFFITLTDQKAAGLNLLFYGFSTHPDSFILTAAFRYFIAFIWLVPALLAFLAAPSPFVLLLLGIGLIPAFCLAPPYAMAPYILLSQPEYSAAQALGSSRQLMKGQKLRLIRLWLSFIPWLFLGLGSFGIGFLWGRSYYQMTMAQFYLALTEKEE